MKKKLVTLSLSLIATFLLVGFSACANDDKKPSSDESSSPDGDVVYTVTDEVKQEAVNNLYLIQKYEGEEELIISLLNQSTRSALNVVVNEKLMKLVETENDVSTTEYFSFNYASDGIDWKYTYEEEYSAYIKEENTDPDRTQRSFLSRLETMLEYLPQAEFDETKKCYTYSLSFDGSGIELYNFEFHFENDTLVKVYCSQASIDTQSASSYQMTYTYRFKDVPEITLPNIHEHALSNWEKDEERHWNSTSCTNHSAMEVNKAAHQFHGTVCSVCGYEAQESEGLIYELNKEETYYTVKSIGTFSGKTLVIPSTYDSLPVKEIDGYAFRNATFTTVIIPDNVVTIEPYAFENCANLENVYTGNGVETIHDYAFSNVDKLKKLVIGTGIKEIAYRAFSDAYEIQEIYIYATLPPEIEAQAWDLRSSHTTLYVSLDAYDTYASASPDYISGLQEFEKIRVVPEEEELVEGICYNKDRSGIIFAKGQEGDFIIPDGVTKIYPRAFENCNYITSVTIPSSVTVIGEYAFYDCDNLKSVIVHGAAAIGDYAFYRCENLTNITLREVTSIGDYAFYSGNKLTNVTIPDSITSMGISAFSRYGKFVQVENGVSYVDNWAIACDTSVTSVTLREDTRGIAAYAFRNCTNLTNIAFPDSVCFLGEHAFTDCSNLASVTFGENCQSLSLGDYAFRNCSNLASVTFGENCQSVSFGEHAFTDCSNLTSVTFGENCQSISFGAYTFGSYPYHISGMIIPNSVTSLSFADNQESGMIALYYDGSKEEFSRFNVEASYGSGYRLFYYSENEPIEIDKSSWRYVDGVPTPWYY